MSFDFDSAEMRASVVATDAAPAAIGPYSAGIRIPPGCGLVYTSGQLPLDPTSGNVVEGEIATQVTRALANALAVAEAGGSSLADIVKVNVYVRDLGQFALINEAYADFFGDECPARAVVEVSRLPRDCSIEIEMIGVVPSEL